MNKKTAKVFFTSSSVETWESQQRQSRKQYDRIFPHRSTRKRFGYAKLHMGMSYKSSSETFI